MPVGTGQKNGMESLDTRSGSGLVVRISSVHGPRARTPEIVGAFASKTACAPAMSLRYPAVAAGDFIRGSASRLRAATKFAEVIRAPVCRRKVFFSRIVCVFPSFDTLGKSVAISG